MIYYTQTAVDTANTNRDGSGTLVLLGKFLRAEYIDRVVCLALGTNAVTEGFLIATNGQGLTNTRNNTLVGREALQATTAGTPADGDIITFEIEAWFPEGWEIYAGVHDAQAAGRQFTAYADATYQMKRHTVHNVTRTV